MIALDTNVLVRLLVDDDVRQSAIARELLESAIDRGDTILLGNAVLCELEWVLESCYKIPRAGLVAAMRELLANRHLRFENRAVVERATELYANGSADFSDFLIGASAVHQGARPTYTFDRALRRCEDFVVL